MATVRLYIGIRLGQFRDVPCVLDFGFFSRSSRKEYFVRMLYFIVNQDKNTVDGFIEIRPGLPFSKLTAG